MRPELVQNNVVENDVPHRLLRAASFAIFGAFKKFSFELSGTDQRANL